MEEYTRNTDQVLAYLSQKNACTHIVSSTRNCFRQLGCYLEKNSIPYSKDAVDLWLEGLSEKYVNDTISRYRNAIIKLNDVYTYGEVRHTTRFKSDGIYLNQLGDRMRHQLEDFLSDLASGEKAEATILNYQAEGSRIFVRLQDVYGITDICSVSYDDVICFFENDIHDGHYAKRYANNVFTKILAYFHKNGDMPYGYTIIIHFLSLGKGTFWNDLSQDALKKIRDLQASSLKSFTLEEFLTARDEIIKTHYEEKYSKSMRCSYNKWLGALYLFLEMNGLLYTSDTAWIWFSEIRKNNTREYRTISRALHLIEMLLYTGKTDLSVMFLEKPNAFLRLPEWCKPDVGSFLSMKSAEGWEDSSLCMYRSCICRFCEFLDSRGITSFSELTAITIKEFNLHDKHATPAGKNAYNIRIRKFLSYLGEEGKLINPMLFVALPAVCAPKETIVVILSKEEVDTVRQAVSAGSDTLSLRKKAMLLLGLKMGIRSSDIVQLFLEDIDWENVTLRFIQEKTDVEITLPIPTDVANALYRYLMLERPQTECRNIFIRERAPYRGVGRSACQRALDSALPERDVPGSGFHVTRKTYASSLLNGGTGIDMVAEALGQVGTCSVHRYLSLDEERMRLCPISMEEEGIPMKGGFQ